MLDRRTVSTMLAGAALAPKTALAAAPAKTVFYSAVGPDLTLYDINVPAASLDRYRAERDRVLREHVRPVSGVRRVLGEDGQAVLGGLGVQGAERLLQIGVNGQRALLARLVLDAGDDGAGGIDEVDAADPLDGRQLLKVVLEGRARLNHRQLVSNCGVSCGRGL